MTAARATPARATPARTTPARATPARATPARATPARAAPVGFRDDDGRDGDGIGNRDDDGRDGDGIGILDDNDGAGIGILDRDGAAALIRIARSAVAVRCVGSTRRRCISTLAGRSVHSGFIGCGCRAEIVTNRNRREVVARGRRTDEVGTASTWHDHGLRRRRGSDRGRRRPYSLSSIGRCDPYAEHALGCRRGDLHSAGRCRGDLSVRRCNPVGESDSHPLDEPRQRQRQPRGAHERYRQRYGQKQPRKCTSPQWWVGVA